MEFPNKQSTKKGGKLSRGYNDIWCFLFKAWELVSFILFQVDERTRQVYGEGSKKMKRRKRGSWGRVGPKKTFACEHPSSFYN